MDDLDEKDAAAQPAESTRVIAVLGLINGQWDRGTLRAAWVPMNPDWGCAAR